MPGWGGFTSSFRNAKSAGAGCERVARLCRRDIKLQKSIDWYDDQARETRLIGGDASIFTKQSEELLRRKWDLQRSRCHDSTKVIACSLGIGA